MGYEPKSCVFAVREPCLRIDSRGNERYHNLYVCKLGMYEKGVGCGPGKCAYFSHKIVEKNQRYWAIKKFRKMANSANDVETGGVSQATGAITKRGSRSGCAPCRP